MRALIFDTKIQQNGVIQIPELASWSNDEVSIIVLRKHKRKENKNDNSESNTKDNYLLDEFQNIRKIKTGKADILTLEKATKIYDELTNIS